jgi:hypothetical protein
MRILPQNRRAIVHGNGVKANKKTGLASYPPERGRPARLNWTATSVATSAWRATDRSS